MAEIGVGSVGQAGSLLSLHCQTLIIISCPVSGARESHRLPLSLAAQRAFASAIPCHDALVALPSDEVDLCPLTSRFLPITAFAGAGDHVGIDVRVLGAHPLVGAAALAVVTAFAGQAFRDLLPGAVVCGALAAETHD